jgi:anti-sigma factor RsiW
LATNPEQAARVAEWRADLLALRSSYDPVLHEPVPAKIALAVKNARGPGWGRGLAAACLALAIGAAGGWFGHGLAAPGGENGLTRNAATAFRVFSVEVRHPVEVGANERGHLTAWLGKRLGSELAAPDLSGQGFELVGGRLLSASGGPAALLMYQSGDGKRVTAYVVPARPGDRGDFTVARDEGLTTLAWKDGGLSWALSGDIDSDRLLRLAHLAFGQLNR